MEEEKDQRSKESRKQRYERVTEERVYLLLKTKSLRRRLLEDKII